MEKRKTIRDIARKAGCHYSTVSLALRDNPKISIGKRKKIQAIAKALNYQPDPLLSALTAYRSGTVNKKDITCLAWLVTSETYDWGTDSPTYPFYYEGAQSRAKERGYRFEKFWLNEKGMTSERISSILWNRGIVGMILPHSERPRLLDLEWSLFSPVCLGYSAKRPKLHMVAPNEYRNISVILRETFLRGYRRPALVESEPSVVRFENQWLGAYLTEQYGNPHIEKIDPYLFREWSSGEFGRWLRNNRPDVIITRSLKVREGLSELGLSCPDDIGLACHCLGPYETEVSGTTKNSFEMGKMAVDFVVDMLHRNERGVPAVAQRHLIEGSWVEGGSLRPRPNGVEADSELLTAASI